MMWARWKRNKWWVLIGCSACAACAHAPAHQTINTPPPFPRVHFATNSTRIVSRDQPAIARNIAWLMQTPTAQILLEGHADARGRAVKNLELGDRRARAVAAALIAQGVAAEQIVGVISRGESAPIAPEHNLRALAANRRVEMVVR